MADYVRHDRASARRDGRVRGAGIRDRAGGARRDRAPSRRRDGSESSTTSGRWKWRRVEVSPVSTPIGRHWPTVFVESFDRLRRCAAGLSSDHELVSGLRSRRRASASRCRPTTPDFNALSVSVMRSWSCSSSCIEKFAACCRYRLACQSNRSPAALASSEGGMRSGSARTRIRSRRRLDTPPSTLSGSSPPSSIERHERIAPGEVARERSIAQVPDLLLAQPAELLR